MRVLCNGIPKSGTHAVERAVQLLGEPDTVQDHVLYTENSLIGIDRHILIIRDLRNVLVSWVRFSRDKVTPGFLICAMKDFYQGMSLAETVRAFAGWYSESNILIVKFEELIADDLTMRDIADYLEVPYIKDSFNSLQGGTATWTGKLSNWQDHWTDDIEFEWEKQFGTFDIYKRQAVNQ